MHLKSLDWIQMNYSDHNGRKSQQKDLWLGGGTQILEDKWYNFKCKGQRRNESNIRKYYVQIIAQTLMVKHLLAKGQLTIVLFYGGTKYQAARRGHFNSEFWFKISRLVLWGMELSWCWAAVATQILANTFCQASIILSWKSDET